jgi:hypothetical protein
VIKPDKNKNHHDDNTYFYSLGKGKWYFNHNCQNKHDIIKSIEIVSSKQNITSMWLSLNPGKGPLNEWPCKRCGCSFEDAFSSGYDNISFVHNCLEHSSNEDCKIIVTFKRPFIDDNENFARFIWLSLNTCYSGDCLEKAEPNGYCLEHQIPF